MNQNESFSCCIIPTSKSVDHTLLRCQLLADNAFKVRAGLYDSSTPPWRSVQWSRALFLFPFALVGCQLKVVLSHVLHLSVI